MQTKFLNNLFAQILVLLILENIIGKTLLSAQSQNSNHVYKYHLSKNKSYQNLVENSRRELASSFPTMTKSLNIALLAEKQIIAETDGKNRIYLSEGLIEHNISKATSEHELQGRLLFILAHEMGHILDKRKIFPSNNKQCKAEKYADTFAGLVLLSKHFSWEIPVKLFREFRHISKTDSDHIYHFRKNHCTLNFDQREYLWIQQYGNLKEYAYRFRIAIEELKESKPESLKESLKQLQFIKKGISPIYGELTTLIDIALATAYHKLWLSDGNDPNRLTVQISLFLPRQFFRINRSSLQKEIPGKKHYFYQAKKYYESYLKNFRDPSFLINYAALLMYEEKNYAIIEQILLHAEKELNMNNVQLLNNIGAIYVYLGSRISEQYDFLSDKKTAYLKKGKFYLTSAQKLTSSSFQIIHAKKIKEKIYYNLAIHSKLSDDKKLYQAYTKSYLKLNKENGLWAANLISITPAETKNVNAEDVTLQNKKQELQLYLKSHLPFHPGESLSNIRNKIQVWGNRYTVSEKEAGGWLFIHISDSDQTVYRMLLKKNESASSRWLLRKITWYNNQYSKDEILQFRNVKSALGDPDHVQGNLLFFKEKNLEIKYRRQKGGFQIKEISLK